MGISNNPTQTLKNATAEVAGSKSLADLKLPEVVVNTLNKAEKYISEKPGVVAAGMAVAAIGNALKYAVKTAPERSEANRIASLEAEQARLRSELEAQRIDDFISPPNKETV